MAQNRNQRGKGGNNTDGTTFALNPTSNLASGSLAVLCIAADNSVGGGSTNNISGVTDSLGNKWVARQLPIFDNGTTSAGVQGGIFTTDQSAGVIQTGTTITVTFGASTVSKTWTLDDITPSAGYQSIFLTGGNASGQAGTTAPTVTTGTIAVDDMVVAMVAIEAGSTQTFTDDTDTSNGSWTASQNSTIGTTTTGSAILSQTKLQTTTGSTQTFNPTLGISSDVICSWVQIREVPIKKLATCGVG